MPERPQDFDVVSFDCYGTLIDWEAGILAALQPVIERHELISSADDVLQAFARAESAVEAGAYLPYREVLRRTFAAMAKDLGFAPQADELETLVETLPRWQPFYDTVPALKALAAAGLRLVVISNVDEDLFRASAERLEVPFAAVITAASARAYKPDPAVFERAFTELGLAPDRFLHCAQSRYHDLIPGKRMGMQTVHVVRDAGRGGVSASPNPDPDDADDPDASVAADWTVPNLAGLVELLGVQPV